jgi:hypothetical protein
LHTREIGFVYCVVVVAGCAVGGASIAASAVVVTDLALVVAVDEVVGLGACGASGVAIRECVVCGASDAGCRGVFASRTSWVAFCAYSRVLEKPVWWAAEKSNFACHI